MDFKFTIKWRKSQVWRGFYGEHEGHRIKVRFHKKRGWQLSADGKPIGGANHPLGWAIMLRVAEELYVHKRSAGDALKIAEEGLR
jgi:hypothetical protein